MGFISGILNSVAHKINEFSNKKTENLGGITEVLSIVKNRINVLSNRFKGSIAHYGTDMLESLDELGKLSKLGKDVIEGVLNKMLDAFISLSAHFLDLVENLSEEMFKLLTQFGPVAKAKGYQVSKIDIKIPSVKFEPVPLFTVS